MFSCGEEMAKKARDVFLAVFLFGFSTVVVADLPSPRNLSLQTLNTNYILKWDWDQEPDSNSSVTFTAQYLAKYKIRRPRQNWITVCNSTLEHHCDFTSVDMYYKGIWLLRVRAEKDSLTSSWVQTDFCPDSDASIGPPSAVEVRPVDGLLEVAISYPLSSSNTSMKVLVDDMDFIIEYWKDPLQGQGPHRLQTENYLVILPDLESWTRYCVRVQCHQHYYNKKSVFSPIYCKQTEGLMPYWQIFLYFLLSLALSFLFVFVLCFCFLKSYKVIRNTFYPAFLLPVSIEEYLYDSPGSDIPRLLTTESESERCCQVDVLPPDPVVTETVMQVHILSQDLAQDSSDHSRHNSGDSGVYSSEDTSGGCNYQNIKGGEEVRLKKINQISFHKECVESDERKVGSVCLSQGN